LWTRGSTPAACSQAGHECGRNRQAPARRGKGGGASRSRGWRAKDDAPRRRGRWRVPTRSTKALSMRKRFTAYSLSSAQAAGPPPNVDLSRLARDRGISAPEQLARYHGPCSGLFVLDASQDRSQGFSKLGRRGCRAEADRSGDTRRPASRAAPRQARLERAARADGGPPRGVAPTGGS